MFAEIDIGIAVPARNMDKLYGRTKDKAGFVLFLAISFGLLKIIFLLLE